MFQIAVKPLLESQFIRGHFEARFRVLVNIHLFRCRRLRLGHSNNLLWTRTADRRVRPFAVRPGVLRHKASWRAKKQVISAGYPPADLSLGRAVSIRTCFAARKRESAALYFLRTHNLREGLCKQSGSVCSEDLASYPAIRGHSYSACAPLAFASFSA